MFEWTLNVVGFLFFVLLCLGIILLIIGILKLIYEAITDWSNPDA